MWHLAQQTGEVEIAIFNLLRRPMNMVVLERWGPRIKDNIMAVLDRL
jgi:hypothetical protein